MGAHTGGIVAKRTFLDANFAVKSFGEVLVENSEKNVENIQVFQQCHNLQSVQ